MPHENRPRNGVISGWPRNPDPDVRIPMILEALKDGPMCYAALQSSLGIDRQQLDFALKRLIEREDIIRVPKDGGLWYGLRKPVEPEKAIPADAAKYREREIERVKWKDRGSPQKLTCEICRETHWASAFPKNRGKPYKLCYPCKYKRTMKYKLRFQAGLTKDNRNARSPS